MGFAYRIQSEKQKPNRGEIKLFKTHTTFHCSFEEYFTASTSQDPIVAPRSLIRAHQAEFGGRPRSRWGAGRRGAHVRPHSRARKEESSVRVYLSGLSNKYQNTVLLPLSLHSKHVHTERVYFKYWQELKKILPRRSQIMFYYSSIQN